MWGDIAIAFLLAFITSFVLTPYTIKIARKIGAVDLPNDERRIHKKPMPKFGGPAIIIGFLVSTIYLNNITLFHYHNSNFYIYMGLLFLYEMYLL